MLNRFIIESIIELENLHWAWEKAKDFYNDDNYWCDELEITKFQVNYEDELKNIQQEILKGTYKLSSLKPIFFPKMKGEGEELKNRQMFWVSIRDQVVWLAVMNVIGKYYDKQMPYWSYGNRLYINIYPNEKESTTDKIKWNYGLYRNTTKKTYRNFGQSWPRFRKDIYITSKIMTLSKNKYEEQFDAEEKENILENEKLSDLHKVKYKVSDFWGEKYGEDVYWCSLDLSKFYPNTPVKVILKNFELYGAELKKRFNDFDMLLKLFEILLSFEIDFDTKMANPDFGKIGLDNNETKFSGIPTGLFGAGFLANIAMMSIDKSLNEIVESNAKTSDKIAIFRYVDDFTILSQTSDALLNIIEVINNKLIEEFEDKLSLNFEKTKPDDLKKYLVLKYIKSEPLVENEYIDIKNKAIKSMKLDANFPTVLMNHTLKKVSTSNRIAFDLLDSKEEKNFIQDLEHLLVTDISEDEIRKDTRLSFTSSKLSTLVPQKKYDYTNIYEIHCEIKELEQKIYKNREEKEFINKPLEEQINQLKVRLFENKKVLTKEIERDRKKVSILLKFAIENYPDKLKLWKNLINFYKNIGFSNSTYLEILDIFELLKKFKNNDLINEFTHEYLITYIYDVLTNAIFSSIKIYKSEYISLKDKSIKESFFNQIIESKVFNALNNPDDSSKYNSFYFVQSKIFLNIAILIGRYYFNKYELNSQNFKLNTIEYCWLINKLGKNLSNLFIEQYFKLNIDTDLNSYDLYLISFYPEINYENMKLYDDTNLKYLSFPWWYKHINNLDFKGTFINHNSKNILNILKFQQKNEEEKNINIFSYIQDYKYTELDALELIEKILQLVVKIEFSFDDEDNYDKLKKQFPYNIYIKNKSIEVLNFENQSIIDKRYFPDFVDFNYNDSDRKFIYGIGILFYQLISKDLDLLPEMYQPSNQLINSGYFMKELEKYHISTFSYEIIKACLSKKNRELVKQSFDNSNENEFNVNFEEVINISTLNGLEKYIKQAIKFFKNNQSKNSKRQLIPKKLFSLTANFDNNDTEEKKDKLKLGLIQVNFDSNSTWGPENDITLHMNPDVEDYIWQEIQKGFHKMSNHHTKPDIIILPELTIPHAYINKLRKLASEINAVIFAGVDWFIDIYRKEVKNKAIMIVPNHWNTPLTSYSSNITYLGKNNPSNCEKKTIFKFNEKNPYKFISDDNMYIIDSGEFGKIGFAICADFYDIERFVVYKGKVQHIIILALNQDTNSFFAISEAVARLVMCNVVICNTGEYGDSLAYSPYKDNVKRMIYRNQGANLFSTQVVELHVKSLIEDQKLGATIDTTDKSKIFKMPPEYTYMN